MRSKIRKICTMIKIVLDANVLIAILDHDDKWHELTLRIEKELNHLDKIRYIITDICVNEAVNVICKRFESKDKSDHIPEFIDRLEILFPDKKIEWISDFSSRYYHNILKRIKAYSGLLNYNDCFLIEYMIDHGIEYIFSYDRDFDRIEEINRVGSADISPLSSK